MGIKSEKEFNSSNWNPIKSGMLNHNVTWLNDKVKGNNNEPPMLNRALIYMLTWNIFNWPQKRKPY